MKLVRLQDTARADLSAEQRRPSLLHLVTNFVASLADVGANVSDPEKNAWVAKHLISVAGADPNSTTIDMEQFKKGLRGMGMDEAAVAAMVAFGTPLQTMSSGQDLYTQVDLTKAGRNHPGAPSNVILPSGEISAQGLKYLKNFSSMDPQLGEVMTLKSFEYFHNNRKAQIMRDSHGLQETIRNFIGVNVVMSGEFGPFLAVAGVPNKDGELVIPMARLDELYNHNIFYRVRAEHDAATLLLAANDGTLGKSFKAPEFLAAFAQRQGVELKTSDQIIDFAKTVLRERNPKVYAHGDELAAAAQVKAQLPINETGEVPGLAEGAKAHKKHKISSGMLAAATADTSSATGMTMKGADMLIDNPLTPDYLKSVLKPRGLGQLVEATGRLALEPTAPTPIGKAAMQLMCPFLAAGGVKE